MVKVLEKDLILYNTVYSHIWNVECASDFPCGNEVLFMSHTGIVITRYLQPQILQVIFCIPVLEVILAFSLESPTTFEKVLRQFYY
jgi:hypothetical protein